MSIDDPSSGGGAARPSPAENALRASEERFRLIVDNARDHAIFTTDPQGRIDGWFAGAQTVFGWSEAEAVGQLMEITYTDADLAAGAPARERAVAERDGSAPNVRWHRRKDGARVFIDGVATVMRDPDGRVRGFLKIGQDVTERRLIQERLRDSEERLRSFAETSTDTLWIVDAQTGQLEYLSPAYEAVWGEPRDAVTADIGQWAARVHPEDRASVAGALDRLRAGERYATEYRIVRPDGAIRYIHDSGFPIWRDGRVERLAGVAQDLTTRRQAEQALAESEHRARTLMEGVPQLVWRAVDEGDWTWASPQWTAFTGQAEADSHGRGWLDVVHPDDRTAALAAWTRAHEQGAMEADYRLLGSADGGYRWFHTRASAGLDAAGVAVEWLGTSTDVQELRALQERQRVLLHELQHRVRNLIAIVRSIAARTAATSASVEDLAMHLDGRLNALARTQMVLTRAPQSGIDLEAVIREELLAQAARELQLDIEGPDVSLSAKAAEVLTLAIHELATNAVKYGALSEPEGRVRVRWSLTHRLAEPWLDLTWHESGVRMASAAPRRRGFGTELVETRVPYELHGSGVLDFRPGGLRCRLSFPLGKGDSVLQTDAPKPHADNEA